jgi:hypothetical protein
MALAASTSSAIATKAKPLGRPVSRIVHDVNAPNFTEGLE